MSKLFRHIICAVLIVFITGCTTYMQQGARRGIKKEMPSYTALLGKSVTNHGVVDFIARNHCTSSGPFQLCQSAGLALWIDADQIVRTARLYVNNSDGFAPYQGELPFGLKFYDIMGAVEYKLKRRGVGKQGLPDEGSSPDHFHYWAVYKEQNMVIVYNSPYPDEDATIYAILVSN